MLTSGSTDDLPERKPSGEGSAIADSAYRGTVRFAPITEGRFDAIKDIFAGFAEAREARAQMGEDLCDGK